MKRHTLQLALALAVGAFSLSASTVTATLPEFDGTIHAGNYPLAAVPVGTFTYTIPVGEHIVSATFSSTYGNSDFPDTAGVDVFVGGIKVGSCLEFAPCDTTLKAVTPFSYSFLASDFNTLNSGSVKVTAVQTGNYIVLLGKETLTIGTATAEPASVALLGMGLAGMAWFRRRQQVRS